MANWQPTIENDIVLLRPLVSKDYESLFSVASDPLIWEQHPAYDRYQPEVFKRFFQDAMDSRGALITIDKETQQVIGSSRYNKSAKNQDAIEIGWSFLARSHWGGKFNRSVKTLMLDHAFRYVDYVLFYIGEENIRSRRATEKLGGLLSEETRFLRDKKDECAYVISKKKWIRNQ